MYEHTAAKTFCCMKSDFCRARLYQGSPRETKINLDFFLFWKGPQLGPLGPLGSIPLRRAPEAPGAPGALSVICSV